MQLSQNTKPLPTITGPSRLWHLDVIRAGVMLLGIPFHVGQIYSTGHRWFVWSPETNPTISVLTGLLSSFRMPLFFFVAGLLAMSLLSRRGSLEWVQKRAERLGIPLITSTLVISPLVIWAFAYGEHLSDGTTSVSEKFAELVVIPSHWVGHLWFLQCLMVYSFLSPLFSRWIGRLAPRHATLLQGSGMSPVTLLIIFALLISAYRFGVNGTFFVLGQMGLLDNPATDFLKIETYFDYLPFYLMGMFAFGRTAAPLHRMKAVWFVIFCAGLVYSRFWNTEVIEEKFLSYAALGPLSVLVPLCVFGFTAETIKQGNPKVDYLVEASFTIYLVHYPVVVWFGYLMQTVVLPPLIEYGLGIAITLAVSFTAHEFVRRSYQLTYLLNGKALAR